MGQPINELEAAVRHALRGTRQPVVLAVSGGVDSMTLLHAAARTAPDRVAAVASFDHGTGPAAREALAHVAEQATSLGFPVVVGRADAPEGADADPLPTEDALRRARWAFLRDVSAAHDAVIATAHTEDDHIETVLMRTMRGAGARGLAALHATSPGVVRPMLALRRSQVRDYAAARGIQWVEDPANHSARYFRNRVRHDLLPSLLSVQPSLERDLLDLSRRAADWRAEVESFVSAHVGHVRQDGASAALSVAASDLAAYDSAMLAVLWPALAARVGLALDRRGTRRLAEFTIDAMVGAVMPLSGGWEVVRRRDSFDLRRVRPRASAPAAILPSGGALRWGRWHFRPRNSVGEMAGADARTPWDARLPADRPISVREWQPGDRLWLGEGRRRRVKRFLAEAGLEGGERKGWPVVLAGEEVIWIPGVRRSDAATERSGRPGVLYHCDVDDR